MLDLLVLLTVLSIIIGGLIYAWKTEMLLVQVIIIQNMLIFFLVNRYISPELFSRVILYQNADGTVPILSSMARDLLLSELPTRAHTLLTSMFTHASFMHIFGNLIVLFFIGMALESRVGKKWTFIFYFATGIFATLGQHSLNWVTGSITIPTLGASGAVWGIMGTLVYLYPRDKITMLLGPILMPRIRVDIAVGVFVMMQTGIALIEPEGIAHAAHITGFLAGIILAIYAKKKGIMDVKEGPTRDYTKLKPLVRTEEQKEIYERVVESDERDVAEAWAEYLIEISSCPKCGRDMNNSECECGFELWED